MAAFGVTAAACASSQDLRDLHLEMRHIAARQDSALDHLVRLSQTSDEVTIDSLQALVGLFYDFRGDVSARLREIQDEQRRTGELVGQNQRTLAEIRDEMSGYQRRLAQQLDRALGPADSTAAEPPNEEESSSQEAEDAGMAVQIYNQSVQNFNRGSFRSAELGFQRFVEEYPVHSLAPAAYMHLGELSSHEDRLQEAVELYLKVPALFPAADETPEALYRAGVLYAEMEQFDQARGILERVAASYPDDRFAALAQERLQDIP